MPVALWFGFYVSWVSASESGGLELDTVDVYGRLFIALVLAVIAADAAAQVSGISWLLGIAEPLPWPLLWLLLELLELLAAANRRGVSPYAPASVYPSRLFALGLSSRNESPPNCEFKRARPTDRS